MRTTLLSALFLALFAASSASAAPQSNQDALFNQAVDAYNRNQFPQALQNFQQVTGPRAADAQQYIKKMRAYLEAIQLAKGIMDRSPDERDANSLEFAIQQYQIAIKIKPDGPWQPADQLAKAQSLKTQFTKAHAASSNAMDMEFCAKALAAAQEHRYKEAAQLSCAVANDNPGYACGGDEAVHMCHVNTDLSKLDKNSLEKLPPEKSAPNKVPVIAAAPTTPTPPAQPAANSSGFDKAKAAYDGNDFGRARSLFQRVDSNPAAADYLDKISRYTDAVTTGEKLSQASQYDPARSAFLVAASIKPDGPGDPQNRVSAMELFLGLDQFYSGDYDSAIQHLQDCARTGTQKPQLVRFYLGASELARFFVTGSEDATLHQDALNDLKQAKQAGFKPTPDVSPKILQVYKEL